jgi:hypothetical protein
MCRSNYFRWKLVGGRRNLSKSRRRSDRESLVIKILIWQSCLDDGPRPSQRCLARQLGVYPSYISKVQKQSVRGLDVLARAGHVTLGDLNKACRFTTRLIGSESRICSYPGEANYAFEERLKTVAVSQGRIFVPAVPAALWRDRELLVAHQRAARRRHGDKASRCAGRNDGC